MGRKPRRKRKTISRLVLGLFVFSILQLISANSVSAYVGSAVFCPNNFQPSIDTEDELELAEATCTYIRSMLANRYTTGTYYAFNEDCDVYTYCSILATLKDSIIIDETVVFSKGHRGLPYSGYPHYNINHISLLDHYGSDIKDHSHIYERTSSKNTFTFIWHCESAEKYQTHTIPVDNIGYYGMPYCWTHNQHMICYGDSGDIAFLGWVNGSPQFETTAEGTWNYAYVAYLFWYYMCEGYTVEGALDEIADVVFGDASYLTSPLRDWLVLWGDRTMELPED